MPKKTNIARERYDVRRRRVYAAQLMRSIMSDLAETAKLAHAPAPKWSRSTEAWVKRYAG